MLAARRLTPCLLAALLSLPLAAPPVRADERSAERTLSSAEGDLKGNRIDSALRTLERLDRDLEGLDDAKKAPFLARREALRKQAADLQREYDRDRAHKRLGRVYSPIETLFERPQESTAHLQTVEGRMDTFREAMASPEAQALSPEERAAWEKKFADARVEAIKRDATTRLGRAEKHVVSIEEWLAGKREVRYYDELHRAHELAAKELEQVPAADPRKAPATQRLAKAKSDLEARIAQNERQELLDGVRTRWKQAQEQAQDSAGWEQEAGPTWDAWRPFGQFDMDKTKGRYRVADGLMDSEPYKKLAARAAQDPEAKAIVDEVAAVRRKASDRLCDAVKALLDEAERRRQEKPKDLVDKVRGLTNNLERYEGSDRHAATLQAIEALVKSLEEQNHAADQARRDLLARCTVAADQAWPELAGEFSDAGTIDPTACVEAIDAWKGRLVKIEGFQNRAGWDYDGSGYTYIPTVNGVPVGCVLDPSLEAAAAKMAEATGLPFEENDMDHVVAVVEGTCRIQGIEYSQITRQHYNTVNFLAPRCRIVAFRAGPFAASVAGPTNLARVDGVDAVRVEGGEVPGGGGGLFGTLFRLAAGLCCCLVFLGGLGGGAYLAYGQWQRQQLAAQAAAAPGASGAAGAPPAAGPAPGAPPAPPQA